MTEEYFNNHVQIRTTGDKYYSATIYWRGRSHICDGYSELEAKSNLWEYLIDEIGI